MRRTIWSLAVLVASCGLVVAITATSAGGATAKANAVTVDVKYASEAVRDGTLPVDTALPSKATKGVGVRAARSATAAAAAADPPIGTVRIMPVLDDAFGIYRLREFTLRAVGQHIEVWVQSGTVGGISATNFPTGDCRNDGVRNVVSDAQIQGLIDQFDNNIYPKESATFSVPPTRDGTGGAVLPQLLGLPNDYYAGDGDKIVTMISNVRDTNFYDTNNANNFTYIAGFFSSQINDFFDRNAMTIDVFDWLHRTGANPVDAPTADPCTSAPARPNLYEGVFAHEYQHLLEHYEDPDEVNWINEGLSDWAETLTGYVTPDRPITQAGFDSHIQCFTGFLSLLTPVNPIPRPACGPENSLTRWEDQGDDSILADYGAAFSMMLLLGDRYGNDFMGALHRDDGNGFVGLGDTLGGTGHAKVSPLSVFDDWTLAVALDGLVDQKYNLLGSLKEGTVQIPSLHSTLLWSTPEAYSSPGAPSNGSDYVQLRDASGAPISGGQVSSIAFKGATTLPTTPIAWTTVADPPGHEGDSALYSGTGTNRDEAIVTEIAVPSSGAASLTFDASWDLEDTWDFAFVQVSTDGGATYTSQPCTGTTTNHDPGAIALVAENVPGYTGVSEWTSESCDLSAFAGKTVLVSFRVINDPAVEGNGVLDPPGFYLDNVAFNGNTISDGSSLSAFKSLSEARPTAVTAFTLRLISIDSGKKKITVKQLPLSGEFSITGNANIQKYVDKKADFVGVVVTYLDPTESVTQYAPYELRVNGVLQPGGS